MTDPSENRNPPWRWLLTELGDAITEGLSYEAEDPDRLTTLVQALARKTPLARLTGYIHSIPLRHGREPRLRLLLKRFRRVCQIVQDQEALQAGSSRQDCQELASAVSELVRSYCHRWPHTREHARQRAADRKEEQQLMARVVVGRLRAREEKWPGRQEQQRLSRRQAKKEQAQRDAAEERAREERRKCAEGPRCDKCRRRVAHLQELPPQEKLGW